MKRASRIFDRDGKSERRVFCPCELCRIRFNRMLYNKKRSGEPLRSYWPAGFRAWRAARIERMKRRRADEARQYEFKFTDPLRRPA